MFGQSFVMALLMHPVCRLQVQSLRIVNGRVPSACQISPEPTEAVATEDVDWMESADRLTSTRKHETRHTRSGREVA